VSTDDIEKIIIIKGKREDILVACKRGVKGKVGGH